MNYQTPQLQYVGVASKIIQLKPTPGNDGIQHPFTHVGMGSSLEAE